MLPSEKAFAHLRWMTCAFLGFKHAPTWLLFFWGCSETGIANMISTAEATEASPFADLLIWDAYYDPRMWDSPNAINHPDHRWDKPSPWGLSLGPHGIFPPRLLVSPGFPSRSRCIVISKYLLLCRCPTVELHFEVPKLYHTHFPKTTWVPHIETTEFSPPFTEPCVAPASGPGWYCWSRPRRLPRHQSEFQRTSTKSENDDNDVTLGSPKDS